MLQTEQYCRVAGTYGMGRYRLGSGFMLQDMQAWRGMP